MRRTSRITSHHVHLIRYASKDERPANTLCGRPLQTLERCVVATVGAASCPSCIAADQRGRLQPRP